MNWATMYRALGALKFEGSNCHIDFFKIQDGDQMLLNLRSCEVSVQPFKAVGVEGAVHIWPPKRKASTRRLGRGRAHGVAGRHGGGGRGRGRGDDLGILADEPIIEDINGDDNGDVIDEHDEQLANEALADDVGGSDADGANILEVMLEQMLDEAGWNVPADCDDKGDGEGLAPDEEAVGFDHGILTGTDTPIAHPYAPDNMSDSEADPFDEFDDPPAEDVFGPYVAEAGLQPPDLDVPPPPVPFDGAAVMPETIDGGHLADDGPRPKRARPYRASQLWFVACIVLLACNNRCKRSCRMWC
jgi:hypothetical protein